MSTVATEWYAPYSGPEYKYYPTEILNSNFLKPRISDD